MKMKPNTFLLLAGIMFLSAHLCFAGENHPKPEITQKSKTPPVKWNILHTVGFSPGSPPENIITVQRKTCTSKMRTFQERPKILSTFKHFYPRPVNHNIPVSNDQKPGAKPESVFGSESESGYGSGFESGFGSIEQPHDVPPEDPFPQD